MHRVTPLLAFAAALVACGSTVTGGGPGGSGGASTSSDGGPGGSGGAPTSSDAGPTPGDGGCIQPTEGAPCSPTEMACAEGDPCCVGYVWGCFEGAWKKWGLGCACQPPPGPFACGNTMCAGDEYCQDHPPGIPPPPDGGAPEDAYLCVPVPAACAPAASCGCVEATIPAGDPCSGMNVGVTCDDDGLGHVTLHCMGI